MYSYENKLVMDLKYEFILEYIQMYHHFVLHHEELQIDDLLEVLIS